MAADKQRRAFISYSRMNKEFATKLTRGLRSAGYPVWFDLFDIPTGARWDDEVEKALRECSIFMVILTPASIASENVKDEIGYAIDHGKRILPVLLEDCDVPLRLRRFQYVDFTTKSFEEGFESAKELLGDLVDEASTPVVVSPTAVEGQLEKKAETERKAKEEAARLATQKAEAERLARQQAEEEQSAQARIEMERKANEEADRLARQKAEAERLAKQKAEDDRLAKVKAETERKAKEEADRLAAQKAEAERLVKIKAEEEQHAREKQDIEKKRLQAESQQPRPVPVAQKPELGGASPRRKSRMPLVFGGVAVAVLVLVGIAVVVAANMSREMIPNTGSQAESPATEESVVESTPTEAQKVVNVPTVKPSPTAIATVGPQKFFTEEFNEDIENWSRLDVTGSSSTNVDNFNLETRDDRLIFDFSTKQLYIYLFYEPFEYENVAVEARVENRGMNDNSISLICRSSDEGWYEFNIANNGLYNFLYGYYEPDGDINYAFLVDGGSNKIKSGNEINVYKILCNDRTLSLYINGTETRVYDDNQYMLRKGKIGISVSSFNQLPVIVEYDWVKISEP